MPSLKATPSHKFHISHQNEPSVNESGLLMVNSNVFVLDDSEQIEVILSMPLFIISFLRS